MCSLWQHIDQCGIGLIHNRECSLNQGERNEQVSVDSIHIELEILFWVAYMDFSLYVIRVELNSCPLGSSISGIEVPNARSSCEVGFSLGYECQVAELATIMELCWNAKTDYSLVIATNEVIVSAYAASLLSRSIEGVGWAETVGVAILALSKVLVGSDVGQALVGDQTKWLVVLHQRLVWEHLYELSGMALQDTFPDTSVKGCIGDFSATTFPIWLVRI